MSIFDSILTSNSDTECSNSNTIIFTTDINTLPQGSFDACKNNCCERKGHGKCEDGYCVCDEGWTGPCCDTDVCKDTTPIECCGLTKEEKKEKDWKGCPIYKETTCSSDEYCYECNCLCECSYSTDGGACCPQERCGEDRCCQPSEILSNGHCCLTGENYNTTAKKCCSTPTKSNPCDRLVSASLGVCPYYEKNCEVSQCNTSTGTCCPSGYIYGTEDSKCCPKEKYASEGSYCCDFSGYYIKNLGSQTSCCTIVSVTVLGTTIYSSEFCFDDAAVEAVVPVDPVGSGGSVDPCAKCTANEDCWSTTSGKMVCCPKSKYINPNCPVTDQCENAFCS